MSTYIKLYNYSETIKEEILCLQETIKTQDTELKNLRINLQNVFETEEGKEYLLKRNNQFLLPKCDSEGDVDSNVDSDDSARRADSVHSAGNVRHSHSVHCVRSVPSFRNAGGVHSACSVVILVVLLHVSVHFREVFL